MALGLSETDAVSSVELPAPERPLPPLAPTSPAWPIVRWIHPTLRDWADARAFAPERKLATQLALPLAGACVLGGFVSGFFGWPTGLLHLLGLYHLVERLFPWLSLREQRAKLEGPDGLVRVTVSPEELIVDRGFGGGQLEPSTSRYRWQDLAGFYPSPHALVLVISRSELLLLPRAAFSHPEIEILAAMLRGQLGAPRPARLRGLVRPLIVTTLVLALWALTQAQF